MGQRRPGYNAEGVQGCRGAARFGVEAQEARRPHADTD